MRIDLDCAQVAVFSMTKDWSCALHAKLGQGLDLGYSAVITPTWLKSMFPLMVLSVALAESPQGGVLIRSNGAVLPADVLDGAQGSPQTIQPQDGAVVIRPGGERSTAEQLGQPVLPVSDATPINLDLQDADIHNVLRFFSSVSDVNIVTSDAVSGSVTVRLEDVPWDLAMAAILQSLGLSSTLVGDRIILVTPMADAP